MQFRFFRYLLWMLVFNHAMWFFGNLYEQIVDIPNLLHKSVAALDYHQITTPFLYHVPNTLLAIVAMVVGHLFAGQQVSHETYRLFTKATRFSIAGIVLTGFIVTLLNLKLFLRTTPLSQEAIRSLAIYWLVGNSLRLVLVFTALVLFLKALQTLDFFYPTPKINK